MEVSWLQIIKEVPTIQLVVNFLGILLTALVTYYFAKQRYVFERLHDRKLVYLEEIYAKIISLEKDLKKYIFTTGGRTDWQSLSIKKEEILPIESKFFDLQDFFRIKEIILTDESASMVQSFLDLSIKTISELKASIVSQSINDPKTSYEQWREAFQMMESKLNESKRQLKEDFKKTIKK